MFRFCAQANTQRSRVHCSPFWSLMSGKTDDVPPLAFILGSKVCSVVTVGSCFFLGGNSLTTIQQQISVVHHNVPQFLPEQDFNQARNKRWQVGRWGNVCVLWRGEVALLTLAAGICISTELQVHEIPFGFYSAALLALVEAPNPPPTPRWSVAGQGPIRH